MAQSGYGKIRLFTDFAGAEIPVANAVAYGTTAGGCNYYIGEFKVVGDLAETDTGLVSVDKSGGWARIGGNDENGKGAAVATAVCFSPVLNGPLACEARVEIPVLTTHVSYIGFCGLIADDVAEPLTSATVTHTLTASDMCGFVMDSQLTASTTWHAVANGGSTTGATASTTTTTGVLAVAAVSQVLRVEIDPNGTARWYIDGKLVRTLAGAVSTTVLQGALVGSWGTTTTATSIDADYFAVEANRDWTI
jgi:hypothetical protein